VFGIRDRSLAGLALIIECNNGIVADPGDPSARNLISTVARHSMHG
jgi:hypothetical protein